MESKLLAAAVPIEYGKIIYHCCTLKLTQVICQCELSQGAGGGEQEVFYKVVYHGAPHYTTGVGIDLALGWRTHEKN